MVNDELKLLSFKIENWRSLARRLHFMDAEIKEFDIKKENVNEKVYLMLRKWKLRNGSGATYEVLYHALCHPYVNHHDLAYKFCIAASSSLVSTVKSRRVVTQFSQIL